MGGQNRLVAVLMAVGFYCVAEWPFELHCSAVKRSESDIPRIPEHSRGRAGVKAAHARAASRSQSLDTGL